jgi:hypothetical protein
MVSAAGIRLSLQTTVTWDSLGGLKPGTTTAPISGIASRRPTAMVRVPIRIRPSSDGIDLLIREPLPGQESAAVIARAAGDGGLETAITVHPPAAGRHVLADRRFRRLSRVPLSPRNSPESHVPAEDQPGG